MAGPSDTDGTSARKPESTAGDAEAYVAAHSLRLIAAAREGEAQDVLRLLQSGTADINFIDPETGFTTLHYAAAYNAIPLLRLLARDRRCDFTVEDRKGRTAASLAYEVAENGITGRFLLRKEMQQRRARQAG
ncbi:ankyrin repeat domain-containing protein [Sinorhizobium meliloti]|nr:ankyrin repeat domain-containing protein [Sinorhizobium meliloti]WQP31718.1 ankyrin repeat domain-containing protein [Sinorhizobium meliloti]